MQPLLAIALGGAAGAVLRFVTVTGIDKLAGKDFPFGTLAVNVIGSFLIGLLFILLVERESVSIIWRSALLVGMLGAFTTFSAFSFETLSLLNQAQWLKASLNIVGSVLLCLAATGLGIWLARQL